MNNQASEAVRFINPFLRRLTKVYPEMEVKLVDERFTSKMAMQSMVLGGMKKKDRKKIANWGLKVSGLVVAVFNPIR